MKFEAYLTDALIVNITKVLNPIAVNDDSHTPKRDGQRPAAVLVPLVFRGGVWQVLLTRRPLHMAKHPGQIAFPGGRTENSERPHEAALRETHEEIGVGADDIHLLGRLPSFDAVSEYRVTPFIGLLNPEAAIKPDAGEVEEVFEIPFEFFMNPSHHIKRIMEFDGAAHTLYDMPWPGAHNPTHHVWGMTAMMIYRLYQRLTALDGYDAA